MGRLIVDTSALVAGVRGRLALDALTESDDLTVPAIVVAEYLARVALDPDPGRSAAQQAFLDEVLAVVPIQSYDRAVAVHHAALLAHVHRTGTARGAHDLVIAATARASRRTILTSDGSAHFDELPGVSVQLFHR